MSLAPSELEARLLHVDEQLLVVDKPAGIAVIPGREESLAHSLRGQLQVLLDQPLWVVHRIDRDTSGVVVFARDAGTHRWLNTQFEHQHVRKTYWALAYGTVVEHGHCSVPLHSARRGKMRPALPNEVGALAAHTEFRRLRLWPGPSTFSELEISPRSGRQHQIRVHLRALGHPLLGDPLYASSTLHPQAPVPPRLALHAWQLQLEHPRSGRQHWQAALPADLQHWLQQRAAAGQQTPR